MCPVKFLGVLAQLALVLVLTIPTASAQGPRSDQQNLYASACNEEFIQLRCPEFRRVAIKRVFHGVKSDPICGDKGQKPRSCCRASHLDCVVNDDDNKYLKLNARCSGQPTCSSIVTPIPTGSSCNASQTHTHYITVIYDCVPEVDIVHLCSDGSKKGPVLYIANREYPSHSLTSQPECSCLIRSEIPGISIHSIDVQLTPSLYIGTRCSKALSIRDPFAFFRQYSCGHRGLYGFRTIYDRPAPNATISLESSHREGAAYLWFQIKPTNPDGEVEIFCGEARHRVLLRATQQVESRHRDQEVTNQSTGAGQPKSADSMAGHGSNITSLSPDLAAIVGGIVAAAFVLFAIVIIAIAVHCRRVREAKERTQTPIHMYPAPGSSGQLALSTSYCHYDADLDTYCSISRSPMKLSHLHANDSNPDSLEGDSEGEGEGFAGGLSDGGRRPRTHSNPSLPGGSRGGEGEGRGVGEGRRTLPGHRSMLVTGDTKSPLGKRSKSVTFSQPVAKVTPLPSGSEESFEADQADEFSKMSDDVFPDKLPPPPPELAEDLPSDYLEDTYPLPPPPRPETIPIAVGGGGHRESPPRPLSTFHSPDESSPKSPLLPMTTPLPPKPPAKGGLPYDGGNYYTGRQQAFWKPSKATGNRDSGEIFEVGV